MRSFKKKYYGELKYKTKEDLEASQSILKYSRQTGRPHLLGDLDEIVKTYLLTLSKRGGVINTTVANATAKALMSKYPHVVGEIDVDSSRWAKSLFTRMNFVKRRKTSAKVDISDGARKEIEFLFLHDIVSKVEKYNIPSALIINIDQTPLKYVPVGNETLAARGEQSVTIEGSADKRSITGTFAISFNGDFLPMQLIYGGKTSQSLPRFEFPRGFSLSTNPKHFSNTEESLKFLKEVINPYVKHQRQLLKLSTNQKALVIMDVFTGQMTTAVLEAFKEANVCIVNVPANMTKFYQPLDLTVNGYAKRFLKRKFNEWYSGQVKAQLDNGVSLDDIHVGLQLTKLKPVHAGWIVEFYNHMTTSKGKEIINSGWKAAGISDALELGSNKMPSIDPFDDIDPMLSHGNEQSDDCHLLAVCDVSAEQFEELCGRKIQESDDDTDDSEWEEAENLSL